MATSSGWLNSFLSEMQQINAQRDTTYNFNPVSVQQNALATRPTIGSIVAAPSSNYAPQAPDNVSGSPSFMDRVLDVLGRPLSAAANLATNVVDEARGINPPRSDIAAVAAGATGKSKETYIDPLKATGMPTGLADILGTVANLGLDPANLVYGPAGKAIVGGIKGLTGATKAAKIAEDFRIGAEANKPDLVGTAAPAVAPEITAPAVTPTVAPTVTPTPIAELTRAPAFSMGPNGAIDLKQGIPKDVIDTAIRGVNSRAYNIGNISSPYKDMEAGLVTARRSPAAQQAFAQRYKTILDPKDYAALQRVRSPQAFDEVAKNILSKTQPTGYKSVSEFVNAAKHGEIPTEEVNKVLDASYSRDLNDLVDKYNAAGGDHTQPFAAPVKPPVQPPTDLLDQLLLDPNSTDEQIAAAQAVVKAQGPVASPAPNLKGLDYKDLRSSYENGNISLEHFSDEMETRANDLHARQDAEEAAIKKANAETLAAEEATSGSNTPEFIKNALGGIASGFKDATAKILERNAQVAAVNHLRSAAENELKAARQSGDLNKIAQSENTLARAKAIYRNTTSSNRVPVPPKLAKPSPGPSLTEQVRAATNSQPVDAASSLTEALKADHVTTTSKDTPSVNIQQQSRRLQDMVMKSIGEQKKAAGIYKPAEQMSQVGNDVYLNTAIHNTAETEAGIAHPVSAVDHASQLPSTAELPALTHPVLRSSDVLHVLGLRQTVRSTVNFKTKVLPQVLLRMAARVLDAKQAGLGFYDAARYADEAGRYWNSKLGIAYNGGRTRGAVEQQIGETAALLAKNMDRLATRTSEAAATHQAAVANAAAHTVRDVETQVARAVSPQTGNVADATNVLSDIGGLTSKAAKGNPQVIDAASEVIAEDIAKITNEGDVRAAKTVKENAEAFKTKPEPAARTEAVANAAKQANGDVKDAAEALKPVMPDNLDPYEQHDILTAAELDKIASKKYNVISTLFGSFARNGRDIAQDAVQGRNGAITGMKEFDNALYSETKGFKPDELRTAFNALQIGQYPAKDTEAYAATKILMKYLNIAGVDVSHMDGQLGNSIQGSMWAREFTTADIHRAFDEAGLPKSQIIPLEDRMNALKQSTGFAMTPRELMSQAWRHVDVENPIDFIARLHGAYRNLGVEASVGSHITERYGSLKRLDGYVRLPKDLNVPKGSRFLQYVADVDKQGRPIYYPKEALEWLAHTEHAVAAASGLTKSSGAIGNFMANHFDPLLAVWKTTVTVARPGFITRNFVGDTMLNFLAGVNGIKPYKDALQVMKAGGRLKNRTVEAVDQFLSNPSDVTEVGKWTGSVRLRERLRL